LADLFVPGELFGAENVLDEEHLVGLHAAGELDGVDAA
jgi:hypothetical protein